MLNVLIYDTLAINTNEDRSRHPVDADQIDIYLIYDGRLDFYYFIFFIPEHHGVLITKTSPPIKITISD